MKKNNEHLRPVMLAGTGSDVGKSIIATALCRIMVQDGYRPAPFKAQNMALNSYATPDGREIGRAQAVQAEAARVAPHTDMNPLLLKPNSEHTTQVVLNGRPMGNRSAYDYFRSEGREVLRREVCNAFDRLAMRYNPIVMEGAGSISELNLRDSDLVNMPMARHADAKVILVADIDRGGVFASAYGSIMLQTPEDRERICGIIVNKFRGDLRLFEDGKRMLEEICGVPVLGVVPMFNGIYIDQEDSMDRPSQAPLPSPPPNGREPLRGVTVAVVLLRHISNFTDFNALERDERVNMFYTTSAQDIEQADIIIIPGTKSTLDDMMFLRRSGMAQAILRAHHDGKTIVGVCGGYQMLGQMICDPDHVEGSIEQLPGLGLLDTVTVMSQEKVTRQVEFDFEGSACHGYEIHQGTTRYMDGSSITERILISSSQQPQQHYVMGTYVHGLFDNPAVIDYLLRSYHPSAKKSDDAADFKDRQYDLLAEHVRKYVDIEAIYRCLSPRPPHRGEGATA